jgi:hypothetical protein
VPHTLTAANIPFTTQVVYKSVVVDGVEAQVEAAVSGAGAGAGAGAAVGGHTPFIQWVVFFSPSGVDAVAGAIVQAVSRVGGESGGGDGVDNDRGGHRDDDKQLRIAAIGGTTAAALLKRNLPVDAVAAKPSAPALVAAIAAADNRERWQKCAK